MIDRRRKAVEERVFQSLVCFCKTAYNGSIMETGCGVDIDDGVDVDDDAVRCPYCGKFIMTTDEAHEEALQWEKENL